MGQKKIALVGFRLNKGGADKVMASLSNYFQKEGFDVHIIIFHDELGYTHSGTVFNLGKLKSKSNTIFNKIKRFYHFNKYIKKQGFDFIIDFRFRINLIQELLISKWIYRSKTIYTVHSSRLNGYMPNSSLLTKFIYGNCYKVVSITNAMQAAIEKKHALTNITTIYNPIDITEIKLKAAEETQLDIEYIIAVGEYDTNIKQFDLLIKAYSESILPRINIHLVILGTGKLKNYLLSISRDNNVEPLVHLLGFEKNPYKYISKAKFLVLSSKYEGLPMVVLESLACGTPAIAFDCPTGPKEIIIHKENGLLIENQNTYELREGMNSFIDNEILYLNCKEGTKTSIKQFDMNIVGKKWLDLMNNMP